MDLGSDAAWDEGVLRGASGILPRDPEKLSVLQVIAARPATGGVDARRIMREALVGVAKSDPAEIGGLRTAYIRNDPTLALTPSERLDPDPLAFYMTKPTVPPPNLLEAFSCPRLIKNSCFIDTLFVTLFVATDLYDNLFLAFRPGTDEVPANADLHTHLTLGYEDHATRWCAILGEPRDAVLATADNAVALCRTVMRDIRSPDRQEQVQDLVRDVRVTLDRCVPPGGSGRSLIDRTESMGHIYDVLLGVTGWERYYMATVVSVDVVRRVEGVALDIPWVRTTKGGASLSTFIGFTYAENAPSLRPLQDIVNDTMDFSTSNAASEPVKDFEGAPAFLLQHAVTHNMPNIVNLIQSAKRRGGNVAYTIDTRTRIIDLPQSGILVLSREFVRTPYVPISHQIAIPRDRKVRILGTEYRLFAVASWQPAHYWCHFWDAQGTMYNYNNVNAQPLTRVAESDISQQLQGIQSTGLLYFLHDVRFERLHLPPPGTPTL